MDQVWVLVRILATGPKPDLPVRLVNPVNASDHPRPFGDLVFNVALLRVDQVEMPPAITFRHVDYFVSFLQPINKREAQTLGMNSPKERFCFLVNKIAELASVRINFDQTEALMPTIGLLIGEIPAIAFPTQPRLEPLVLEAIH